MKNTLLLALFLSIPALTQADLKIFACEPEWEALAVELGGDKIEASSATSMTMTERVRIKVP